MKTNLLFFFFILITSGVYAQNITAYSASQLMERTSNKDTVYVVNFWATWCAPCVKELPEFNLIKQTFDGKPVKVLLVSFDFKESYPKSLQTFITKKTLLPEVAWFTETDANEFIPKIDKTWSGALPATIVISAKKNTHIFMERSITATEIIKLVNDALQ